MSRVRLGHHRHLRILFTVSVMVLSSQICSASAAVNNTGRVRVLSIGEPHTLMQEPLLDVDRIPAFRGWYESELIERAMRHYMPRRYRDLVDKYDVVGLIFTEPRFFTAQQIKWISDAVLVNGSALVFYGDVHYFYPWLETTVGDVSPVDDWPGLYSSYQGWHNLKMTTVWIRVLKPENSLMASLPWSDAGKHGCFLADQGVKAKIGAEVLADKAARGAATATPFLTWWKVGAGQCLAITPVYTSTDPSTQPFLTWEYYPDFFRNCHLYVSEKEIPEDSLVLHEITDTLKHCHDVRSFLLDLAEFVSSFGGSPGPLDERLDLAEKKLRTANRAYLEYEFDNSLSLLQGLFQDLEDSVDFALKLKDRTMFLIYLIEWAILTTTAVLAGTVVWTLMVRRRLYKEVKITRQERPLVTE